MPCRPGSGRILSASLPVGAAGLRGLAPGRSVQGRDLPARGRRGAAAGGCSTSARSAPRWRRPKGPRPKPLPATAIGAPRRRRRGERIHLAGAARGTSAGAAQRSRRPDAGADSSQEAYQGGVIALTDVLDADRQFARRPGRACANTGRLGPGCRRCLQGPGAAAGKWRLVSVVKRINRSFGRVTMSPFKTMAVSGGLWAAAMSLSGCGPSNTVSDPRTTDPLVENRPGSARWRGAEGLHRRGVGAGAKQPGLPHLRKVIERLVDTGRRCARASPCCAWTGPTMRMPSPAKRAM